MAALDRRFVAAVAGAMVLIGGAVTIAANDAALPVGQSDPSATPTSAETTPPPPEPGVSPEPDASAADPGDGAAPASPASSASPLTEPTAAPIDPAVAERAAYAAVDGYLRTSQQLLAAPDGPADPVAQFASGAALGLAQNQALEFQDLRARITGTSQVVWRRFDAGDLAAAPPTVVVTACLDDSAVKVFSPENPEGVSSALRTETIFTVAFDGSGWRVVDRTFGDQPLC